MSEFDETDIVDGGYVEHKGNHLATTTPVDRSDATKGEVSV